VLKFLAKKRENSVLKLRVRGPGVRRGRIPVPESIQPVPVLFAEQNRFFAENSLESIVQSQKVDPHLDVRALEGGIAADEDLDSFLEEIYSGRG
jgi:hypothetical protein